MIGSAPALGVATPKEATLFIISTFVSHHNTSEIYNPPSL
jgi:hypothetical protein